MCSDENIFYVEFNNLPSGLVTMDIDFTLTTGAQLTNILPLPPWPECIIGSQNPGNNPMFPIPILSTQPQYVTNATFTFISALSGSGIQHFQLTFIPAGSTGLFEFSIPLDCSLIPIIPNLPGNSQFHLHQEWKHNALPLANVGILTTPITTPYLIAPLSITAPGNYGQFVDLLFAYENTGNATADIDFTFNDLFISPCGTSSPYELNTLVPNPITYYVDALPPNSYTNSGPNHAVIPQGSLLFVKYQIKIIDCLNSCQGVPLAPAIPKVEMSWRCNNSVTNPLLVDFCENCQHQYVTDIIFNTEIPTFTVKRIPPLPDIANYDVSCIETQQNWQVEIKNTSLFTTLASIDVHLFNPAYGPNGLTVIYDDGTNILTLAPSCLNCTSTITTDILTPPILNPACSSGTFSPIPGFTAKIENIPPGGEATLSFNTVRCCKTDDDLLNQNKSYNQWHANVQAVTVCGTLVTPSINTLALDGTGIISGHGETTTDINLETNFTPSNPLDLTVDIENTHYGPKTDQVIELNSLFGNNKDKQVLGYDANGLGITNGILRVKIFCEEGLLVHDLVNDISLSYTINSVVNLVPALNSYTDNPFSNPIEQNHLHDCGDYNYYFYYDLGLVDIDAFFTTAKFSFSLETCCDVSESPSEYHVYFSLLPNNSCFTYNIINLPVAANGFECIANSTSQDACCWVPLAEKGYFINVHCPGCRAPGIIVDSYVMKRISLGYPDADNNRVADNTTAPIDPTTYVLPLNTTSSIHGDKVEDKLVAYFVNGNDVPEDTLIPCKKGYTYSNMTSQGAVFNTLQLLRDIEFSQGDIMNLQPQNVILYVDIGAGNNTGCVDCSTYYGGTIPNKQTLFKIEIDPVLFTGLLVRENLGIVDGNKFLFTYPLSLIQDSAPPAGVTITNYVTGSNLVFTFLPEQYYRMSVVYSVCGNTGFGAAYSDDNLLHRLAEIKNNMWLTGGSFTLSNYENNLVNPGNTSNVMPNLVFDPVTQDGTMMEDNYTVFQTPSCCNTCTLIDQTFANNYRFFCETCSNTHNFYSTDFITVGDYFSSLANNCEKEIRISMQNSFGRNKFGSGSVPRDLFPNEFRPVSFFPDLIMAKNIPINYVLSTTVSPKIQSIFWNQGILQQTTPVSQVTATIINNEILLDNSVFNGLQCIEGMTMPGSGGNILWSGDEVSVQKILLYFEPDCTNPPVAGEHLFNQTDLEVEYTDFNFPCIPPASIPPVVCSKLITQNNLAMPSIWTHPNPNLKLTFINPTSYAISNEVCWNFEIQNENITPPALPYFTFAPNVYLGLPGGFAGWSIPVCSLGIQAVTPVLNGNIFGIIENLPLGNDKITGTLCGVYTPCQTGNAKNQVDVTFDWGWNCNGFPVTTNPADVCNNVVHHTTVQLENMEVKVLPIIIEAPPVFVPCSTYTVKLQFENKEPGTALPTSFSFGNLLPPFSQPAFVTMYDCSNPGNSATLVNTNGLYDITVANLNSCGIASTTGYMKQKEKICFEFAFEIGCTFEDALILPVCTLQYTNYCGTSNLNAIAFLPDITWDNPNSNCIDCYTVIKTADPIDIIQNQQNVTWTISVEGRNNPSNGNTTVNLFDDYPCSPFYFPTGVNPFGAGGSGNTTSVNVPAIGIDPNAIITIQGFFTQPGMCINHSELTTGESGEATVTVHSDCSTNCFVVGTLQSSVSFYSNAAIQSGISNCTDITVNGTLYIDNNAFFYNKVFRMNPGSEIIVDPAMVLSLNDCNILSCDGFMWKGISLHNSLGGFGPGSTFICTNTNIYDAQYATTINDHCRAYIWRTNFINNYTGIYVPPNSINPPPYMNQIVLWMEESTIAGSGSLALPYIGQNPAISATRPFAGILAYSANIYLNVQNIAPPNIFEGLSNAIVSNRCNLYIENCKFKNIQADNSYNDYRTAALFGNQFNGSAIYGISSKGGFEIIQKGLGKTDPSLSFENCGYMIYGDRIGVTSTDNNTLGLTHAYQVTAGAYFNIRLSHNTLDTYENTIDLLHNDGSANTIVWDNDITFGDVNAILLTPPAIAINVQEAALMNNNSRIHDNHIIFRSGASNAHTGIFTQSVRGYFITENVLDMNNNDYNINGIFMSDCYNTNASCNIITGNKDWGILDQSAIRNDQGDGPVIACNTVDGTENGVFIVGTVVNNTEIKGNNFKDHTYAFHYGATGFTVADQDWKGNLWLNPALNGGYQAKSENLSAYNGFQPPFFDVGPIATGFPITQDPPGWFKFHLVVPPPDDDFYCNPTVPVNSPTYCSQFSDCPGCRTEFDELIAGDSINNDPYTSETLWMLERGLLGKIEINPSQYTDSLMTAFYQSKQGTSMGALKDLDSEKQTIYDLDSISKVILYNNSESTFQLLDTVNMLMVQLKMAIDSGYSSLQTNNEINQYLTLINSTQVNSDSIESIMVYNQIATSNVLLSDNAAIIPANLIETNEQDVNEIYLTTIGNGIYQFNLTQLSTLLRIAAECPMEGGSAVYKARSILSLVYVSLHYNDRDICNRVGIAIRQQQLNKKLSCKIYPNPANEKVYVEYTFDKESKSDFVLTNTLGQVAKYFSLSSSLSKFEFSTTDLKPGMYYYSIRNNGLRIDNGKLIIFH